MKIQFADRMDGYEEGIFQVLNEKKNQLLRSGRKVYNLSVGTPDFKPSAHVMEALTKASREPENYKYALADKPELIAAVVERYKKRYSVELKETEVMSVYGSQEGIAHIALALCNPGDVVLVPDPGYPIFSVGPSLAGARLETYPLRAENGYLPELDRIPETILRKTKFMVVSYPLNPVCAAAPREFYEELVRWAAEKEIVIVHDNAYSDIIFDGREGISFLSVDGAKEIGVEFYSLSKSFDLTGARIAFMAGNEEIVRHFKKLRSQIDYGIFVPVQHAAIAALTGPDDDVRVQCAEYQRRRDALCGGLRAVGWDVPDSQGTMFAWAPVPKGYDSSIQFVMDLMERTGVLCTPGSSFGSLGEGYVRFALVLPADTLREMAEVIGRSGVIC